MTPKEIKELKESLENAKHEKPVSYQSSASTATQGVKIINLKKGDRVVSMAKVRET